jgi:hypothetical protein
MSSYWNRIIKIPTLELCDVFKMANKSSLLPIVQGGYLEYKKVFPNLPQTCPIPPNKYYQNDIIVTMAAHIYLPNNPVMKEFYYPNGRYKLDFFFSTKDNPTFFQWGFILEVRNRLGQDKV